MPSRPTRVERADGTVDDGCACRSITSSFGGQSLTAWSRWPTGTGRRRPARAASRRTALVSAARMRPAGRGCSAARRTPRSVDREGVGVAEGAHRDHLDGPRAEAGQRRSSARGPVPVAAGVEPMSPSASARDQRDERALPATSGTPGRPGRAGQLLRRREQVGEPAVGIVDRLAVCGDEPGRRGCGPRCGHLLAEHGPHGELVLVDGARHPPPGRLGHQRRQQRCRRERVVDRDRVGVEVEQAAAARDRRR